MAPPETAPLTKAEAREMPPAALNRRLFGDLGRTLLPIDRRPPPGAPAPTRRLERLDFITPARSPDESGLCMADYVVVEFEPAGALQGAETPVRPSRFSTSVVYFVHDPARLGLHGASAEYWAGEAAACAAIDPRKARFLTAPSADSLAYFMRRTIDLIDAARAGRKAGPLECEAPGPDGDARLREAECLAAVGRIDAARLSYVQPCDGPRFPTQLCYTMSDGLNALDFEMRPGSEEPARIFHYQIINTYWPPPD